MTRTAEQGPIRDVGPGDVLAALSLARTGRVYDLEVERFRGMPLHPAHPQLEILTYRSPRGIRNQGDQAWLAPDKGNSDNMAFISDLLVATVHSGTHIDALSHVTVGEDDHFYGGHSAADQLGDWGPLVCDAGALPPIITRGVLLDVAGWKGVDVLARGEGISAEDLQAVAAAQGVQVRPKDTVLVRTGYVGLYPDADLMAHHAGPTRSRWSRSPAPTPTTRTPSTRSCWSRPASTSSRWPTSSAWPPTACTSSPSSRCPARSAGPPAR
jgi:hypothetical protein